MRWFTFACLGIRYKSSTTNLLTTNWQRLCPRLVTWQLVRIFLGYSVGSSSSWKRCSSSSTPNSELQLCHGECLYFRSSPHDRAFRIAQDRRHFDIPFDFFADQWTDDRTRTRTHLPSRNSHKFTTDNEMNILFTSLRCTSRLTLVK